jgi:hypothetical protein
VATKACCVIEDGYSASPVPPGSPDVRECGGLLPPRASLNHGRPRTGAMPRDGSPSRGPSDPRVQGGPLIQRVPARPEIAVPAVMGTPVRGLVHLHRDCGLAPHTTSSSPPIPSRRLHRVGRPCHRGPLSPCYSPQAPTKPGVPWPEYFHNSTAPRGLECCLSETTAPDALGLSDVPRQSPHQSPPTGQSPPRAPRYLHFASPPHREVSP